MVQVREFDDNGKPGPLRRFTVLGAQDAETALCAPGIKLGAERFKNSKLLACELTAAAVGDGVFDVKVRYDVPR